MKIITAKEFRRRQSQIIKEVAAGQSYQLTYHRQPLVNLTPVKTVKATKPRRGSREAFLESLKHTVQSTGDLHDLSYKELRAQMNEEKYGKL